MTKTLSKLLVVVAIAAAVLSLSGIAEAQTTYPTDDPVIITRGSTFEPDPATANTGFLGFESVQPIADADAVAAAGGGTSTGGTGGGLAITGVETNVALAVGMGLLAVGSTAVIASRKRTEDE